MTARDFWKWRLGERTEAVVQWRWRVVEDPLIQQAIMCFHSFLRYQDVVWTRCLRCVEYPHQRLFVRRTTLTDKMLYRTVCFALDARERIGGDERVNGRRVDGDIVLSYPYVRVILDFYRSTEESPREEHHFHLAGKRSKVLMEFKQYGLDFLVKTFIDTGIENTEIKCVGFQAVRHILSNKHHLGYRRIRFRSARELHTVPCAFRSKGHL